MALKCYCCSEIRVDMEELDELCSSETFIESQGRIYSRALVSSGLCPDCYGDMASDAVELGEALPAA